MTVNHFAERKLAQLVPSLIAILLMLAGYLEAEPVQGVQKEWPREIHNQKGKVMIYQPQVDSWDNYKVLVARAALGFAPKGSEKNPQLGIIEMKADTEVDFQSRLVRATNFQITGGNFPSLTKERSEKFLTTLRSMIKPNQMSVSLDRILISLNRAGVKTVPVKNDPPPVYVSTKPAILVVFDGAPIFSPIKGIQLKYAVNTNWDVVYDEKVKTYYLRNETYWLQATDLKGKWTIPSRIPSDLRKLPNDENWKETLKNVPGNVPPGIVIPIVFVSEVPAEMILIDGQPNFQPIPETKLMWVKNTTSDLFYFPDDKNYYYLVSGRWFRNDNFDRTWAFATQSLPAAFKKIPKHHERGDVRASVPGTREAEEAVIQASIPQTAKISKNEVKAPKVVYLNNKPSFKPIEGTSVSYASNTAYDVLQFGNSYYLCYQGVWFVSDTPNGPWKVGETIPPEIYSIPPNSPLYHTTYVTVVDDHTNDDWVTVALYAGYFGTMIAEDSVVWGTGWYYPPYVELGATYAYYYPYAYSYGAGAFYNPFTGTFGRYGVSYGPYGGLGFSARYNPTTGTYARGAAAYGIYGGGRFVEAYNPRTGSYARTQQGTNYYSSWGASVVRRGDDWVRSAHYNNANNGAWGYRTSDGKRGAIGYRGDDLYAGRDGNVYRRTDTGWQTFQGGAFVSAEYRNQAELNAPNTLNDLNRYHVDRQLGAERSSGFQNFQHSGGMRAGRAGGSRR
jgi:hypothetical protein